MKYWQWRRLNMKWWSSPSIHPSSPRLRRTGRANGDGFTLIELMVVIGLIALLALLTTANLNFFERIVVRAEIEKLHTLCRYLQRCAIASNKEYHLVFDASKNNYRYENHVEQLPRQVLFGFLPDAHGPPAFPRRAIQKPITFQGNRITFYPSGILSAGTLYLIDRTKQSMYALSNAVSQVSYLRMYHYTGEWQLLSGIKKSE